MIDTYREGTHETARPFELGTSTRMRCVDVNRDSLPHGYKVKEQLGIAAPTSLSRSVVYCTDKGTLFETRGIKTSGGDYLLMFPTNTQL